MRMLKPAAQFYEFIQKVDAYDNDDEIIFSEHYIFGGGNTFHHEGKRLERCVKLMRGHNVNTLEVRMNDTGILTRPLGDLDEDAILIVKYLRSEIDRF